MTDSGATMAVGEHVGRGVQRDGATNHTDPVRPSHRTGTSVAPNRNSSVGRHRVP